MQQGSAHTRVGTSLWEWERWGSLEMGARNLWLCLYTSSPVKRLLPGLWHGGFASLTEEARMGAIDAEAAMRELEGKKMVEWDQRCRVLRLTEFPDDGERPDNGKAIFGWWNRFRSVPQCDARDNHVTLLAWLFNERPMSGDHERAWSETFATVRPRRARGKRHADPDQRSLFADPASSPPMPVSLPVTASDPFVSPETRSAVPIPHDASLRNPEKNGRVYPRVYVYGSGSGDLGEEQVVGQVVVPEPDFRRPPVTRTPGRVEPASGAQFRPGRRAL